MDSAPENQRHGQDRAQHADPIHKVANQSLIKQYREETSPVPNGLTLHVAVSSTSAAGRGPALKKGRVLLLEDDEAFREIITDCLTEEGYTVVAVPNGGEGVREVLFRDFSLVVCDLMMPSLPGDMFYRAVQSIRPALCQRFIFMTGYRNDERTNNFVKEINAFVLRKPFHLDLLLDAIVLAEVRSTYESVCNPAPENPSAGPVAESARIIPFPDQTPREVPVPETKWAGASFWTSAVAGLAVLAFPMGLGLWYWTERNRAVELTVERENLEAQWAMIAPALEEAAAFRAKAELAERQRALVLADRARPRWTPALGSIAMAAEEGIEIRDINARADAKNSGACMVRIRGLAGGARPRLLADRWRLAVEEHMGRSAQGVPVSTRFERLEDEPGTPASQPKANFVVAATFGSIEPPSKVRKEVR